MKWVQQIIIKNTAGIPYSKIGISITAPKILGEKE